MRGLQINGAGIRAQKMVIFWPAVSARPPRSIP
jgi:hypothetical protein